MLLPDFANDQVGLKIDTPYRIKGSVRIFLGDDVSLGPNCFLYASKGFHEPDAPKEHQRERTQIFDSAVYIGNRVRSRSGLQIVAMKRIDIGDDVIFAANVFVSDGTHGYANADEPYRYQPIGNIKPVNIQKGCWIGQNAVIMPGVSIGENSIIGANSVVTKNVPPRSIAVGTPAKVTKTWNVRTRTWMKVVRDGVMNYEL